MKVLERRGWQLDQSCLSFIGYEGGKAHVSRQKAIVKDIVDKHGGIVLGKGPGVLYDQKKFDTPYLRDFLLDRGAIGDVSETAAPWSKLKPLYDNVMAAANRAFAELGVHGLDHVPPVALLPLRRLPVLHLRLPARRRRTRWPSTTRSSPRCSRRSWTPTGRLSHHHAVGTEHAPWLEQDISAPGVHMIDGLFSAMDPGGNFNPGKIVVK